MNCSKTKVLGIHGTIKEVYGLDDWKINIRGFCIADKSREGYKTVAEQVNALQIPQSDGSNRSNGKHL